MFSISALFLKKNFRFQNVSPDDDDDDGDDDDADGDDDDDDDDDDDHYRYLLDFAFPGYQRWGLWLIEGKGVLISSTRAQLGMVWFHSRQ